MKKFVGSALLMLLLTGCSKSHLMAKYYIYQGEQYHYKAYQLKTKKNSTESRKQLYRKSCDTFLKAYDLEPQLFNFYQAMYAEEACSWVEDRDSIEKFRDLLDHLQEPSYGPDGGSAIMME